MQLSVTHLTVQVCLALIKMSVVKAAATPESHAPYDPYVNYYNATYTPYYRYQGYDSPAQHGPDYAPFSRESYPEEYYGNPEDYEHQEDFRNSYYPKPYLQPPRESYAPSEPEYYPEEIFETDRVLKPIHHSSSTNVINEENWEGRLPNAIPKSLPYAPSFSSQPKVPPYHYPSPTISPPAVSSTPNINGVSPTSIPVFNFPEVGPSPSPIPREYSSALTSPTPMPYPDTVSVFPLPPPHRYPVDGFSRTPYSPSLPSDRYPSHPNVIYEAPGHNYPK